MTDPRLRLTAALADQYRIERERGLTAFPGLEARARRFAGRPEGRSTSVAQSPLRHERRYQALLERMGLPESLRR